MAVLFLGMHLLCGYISETHFFPLWATLFSVFLKKLKNERMNSCLCLSSPLGLILAGVKMKEKEGTNEVEEFESTSCTDSQRGKIELKRVPRRII